MWRVFGAVLALVAASTAYFLIRLYQLRKEMEGLPGPPRHSWLVGNINIAADCQKHFPPDLHPQPFAHYMRKKHNLGKFFYVDWWPLGPRFLYIADPELSSQFVTTTQSLPKSSLETDFLTLFLGKNNMVSLEGGHWKSLRSMFNPGFSLSHLMTLVPYIVDASLVFCDVLRRKAATGELMELDEDATNLTIDIIGKVVLDSDLNAQKSDHPIVRTFRRQIANMPPAAGINPFSGADPLRPFKLWWTGRKLDRLIGEELDRKIIARTNDPKSNGMTGKPLGVKERKRSVVDLALDYYEKDVRNTDPTFKISSRTAIPNAVRKDIIDSMKTFIFAGHDTTATVISYVFYLMHVYPSKHARACAELTSIFGTDPSRAAEMIKDDPHIINKLEYITAIIKETLRLFPPASTLRYQPPTSDPSKMLFLTDPDYPGAKFPMNGFHIWPLAHTIMRNETFFPNAPDFVPERFLPNETPFPDAQLFSPAGKDAWRPFEKGPRNCIGQELAMLESKVILALTLREFDFVAEYDERKIETVTTCESVDEYNPEKLGGRAEGDAWPERTTVEGHRCYQILKGSAKPAMGMPGRVSVRK